MNYFLTNLSLLFIIFLQCQAVMKKDEITVHNYYIYKSNRCKDIDKAQNIRDLGITSTLIQPRVTVRILGYGNYVILWGRNVLWFMPNIQ